MLRTVLFSGEYRLDLRGALCPTVASEPAQKYDICSIEPFRLGCWTGLKLQWRHTINYASHD